MLFNLVLGLVVGGIILWIIFRLLTSAVVWVARSVWNIDIKVRQVGIFMLGKITLNLRPGVRIDVERLWLSSSYINGDIKKPLAICLGDARVQIEAKPRPRSHFPGADQGPQHEHTLAQRKRKLYKWLGWAQHFCVSLDNLHVIFVHLVTTDCLTHSSIQEIEAHITLTDNWLEIYFSADNLTSKVLKSIIPQFQGSDEGPCLAELALSASVRLAVDLDDLSLQIVETSLKKSYVRVSDGAFLELETLVRKQKTNSISRFDAAENLDVTDDQSTGLSLNKFIPKEIHFHSEDFRFIVSKESGRKTMQLQIQDVNFDLAQSLHSGIVIGNILLAVRELVLASPQINLANLGYMELKMEGKEKAVSSSCILRSCFLGYHHDEFQYWTNVASKLKLPSNTQMATVSPQRKNPVTSMKRIIAQLRHRIISFGFDIEDGSIMAATETCAGIKAGISHLKVTSSLQFASDNDIPVLHTLKWELELQAVYCKMTEGGAPSAELSAKLHHWGTVFYLGMLIIKARKLAQELTLDTMLDSIQLEWSAPLASALTTTATVLKKKHQPSAMKPNIPVEKAPTNIDQSSGPEPGLLKTLLTQAQINVQCSNINVYIVNELKVGVLFRNDSLAIQQRTSAELMISCQGNKLAYFHQKNKTHNVVRCHDLQHFSGYMKKVDVSYKQIKHEIGVKVSEEFFFHWATALHMVMFEAGQQVKEVTTAFKAIKPAVPRTPSINRFFPPPKQETIKPLNFAFSIRALCNIVIKLSKEHKMSLKTDHFSAARRSNRTSAKLEKLDILFDENKIFNIEGLHVEGSDSNDILKVERQGFDTLQLPVNKSWTIEVDKFEIIFPHNYDFAAGFEQVVNLNKWRKLVHHVKKPAFTADSPLPPDLIIKAKSFVMVVCDDPFEVKLGDNYELLMDEYNENEKRWAAMENRIEELRKKYTLLSASKIEELYVSLHKKSAEVYIHRSGQLYSATPMRHKLFQWTLDNLEIVAMADPTLHGKENVVTHMKEIDQESPYPEDGLEFTTLWCRQVHASVDCWQFKLRDYPTPWLDIQDLHIWGRLVGAEQMPTKRAVRSNVVEVSAPWDDVKVQRFMPPLKFYHDFSCDVNRLTMAYGPCWDPAVSEFNLCLNFINRPSVDPSAPLPFWDKFRLLFHGRLTMSVQKMRWLYHASLNPNNTTEFMDWSWTNLILDWTNAKWVLRGDLDIFARTASKYDDCRLLHLPNLRFCLHLDWVTLGDPNDHYSVMPCAPDKVPEYSLQEHDSYRAFRSLCWNYSLSLVTKPHDEQSNLKPSLPSCIFYASTLRWIDKVKMCMTSVSRPIRRGKYFNRAEPRKPQLSRHIRNLNLSVSVHEFKVCYWVSFAKQHGMEMLGKQFCLDVGPQMMLTPRQDGLLHRAVTEWSINSFTSTLHQTTIWLCSTDKAQEQFPALKKPVNRSYFLSIENLTYERDGPASADDTASSVQSDAEEERARHKVILTDLRLGWTPSNRNIMFHLLDIYNKSQVLQKSLASDALKGFKVDMATPSKARSSSNPSSMSFNSTTPSPMAKLQHSMLQKLVSEADSRFVAVSEEVTGGSVKVDQLHGIAACQTDDVVSRNCHIVLHNSQVLLRGVETQGYVIVSASRAVIRSREHEPIWQGKQLKSKTTWVGKIEVMQYYATMGMEGADDSDICWVSAANVSDINEEQASVSPTAGLSGYGIEAIPDRISTDRSVGGVIVDTSSGTDDAAGRKVQLQRIISRCSCDVFYASYGEVDPETTPEVPPPPSESNDMMQQEEGADSFTLLHHDLNICTNPAQYERIMDIVNNLLLYVEPHKKEAHDKLQNMRFKFALSNMEDMRTPILDRQNNVRDLVSWIRHKERAIYMVQKTMEDEPDNEDLQAQSVELSEQLEDCKQELNAASEELAILISCYKESQLQIKAAVKSKGKQAPIVRRHEICFTHAEWRMMEVDGQIGIADLVLRNFLYNKVNREDDSGIHQLELGWVRVTNLIPNTPYKDVLIPQETGESNHQMALRIQCRFKAPVGGISIREHFEVNVIPMSIQLTHRFYQTVMAFFFPGKKIDDEQPDDAESDTRSEAGTVSQSASSTSLSTMSSGTSRTSKKKQSSRKLGAQDMHVDDIDKMKERAAQNNMFLYIKIPEVDLRVSYKGSKDKNLIDVQNIQLQLPTLQYHNETWTWFDFLMAVKKDSRKVLIGQAIKQKLHMKSKTGDDPTKTDIQQDDKARMLFGGKLTSVGEKSTSKKSLFGKSSHK